MLMLVNGYYKLSTSHFITKYLYSERNYYQKPQNLYNTQLPFTGIRSKSQTTNLDNSPTIQYDITLLPLLALLVKR